MEVHGLLKSKFENYFTIFCVFTRKTLAKSFTHNRFTLDFHLYHSAHPQTTASTRAACRAEDGRGRRNKSMTPWREWRSATMENSKRDWVAAQGAADMERRPLFFVSIDRPDDVPNNTANNSEESKLQEDNSRYCSSFIIQLILLSYPTY